MAARRLPRGTRKDPVVFPLSVEKSSRDTFKQIATHNNMSASALFDALVKHMPLDMNGRPTWLPPEPVLLEDPTPHTPKDGELPIEAA